MVAYIVNVFSHVYFPQKATLHLYPGGSRCPVGLPSQTQPTSLAASSVTAISSWLASGRPRRPEAPTRERSLWPDRPKSSEWAPSRSAGEAARMLPRRTTSQARHSRRQAEQQAKEL